MPGGWAALNGLLPWRHSKTCISEDVHRLAFLETQPNENET
jgi:hypothetical protein